MTLRVNSLYDDEPAVLPGLESVADRNARRRATSIAVLDGHSLPIESAFDKCLPPEEGGLK